MIRHSFLGRSSCSHTRTTRHPWLRRVRVTRRSRSWFPASFFRQNSERFFGLVPCLGHPCQKHPSTKIASRSLGKMKSGRPKIGTCRLHPTILYRRSNRANATSVSLFPRDRIAAITRERFPLLKTSLILVTNPPLSARSASPAMAGRRCLPACIVRCAGLQKNSCPERSGGVPPRAL